MTVRAVFFASYRDLAGADELHVELPASARISDLLEALRGRAGLAALPAAPAVALNMEYSALSAMLCDGDEVAFIPPVAGG